MGKIIILEETTKNPISLMGQRAGVCWGGDITDANKNYKRGLDCLASGHGRVMEYVNVEIVLEGYSARVIREWYTHLGGSPTRLQASTRYVDYGDFPYVIPPSIKEDPMAEERYRKVMEEIRAACNFLEMERGIPREDASMLLPLGMETRVVDKRNLRNLVDMSHQRMCSRAYHEYRGLMQDVSQALMERSEEWYEVVTGYFMPKCEMSGYCTEKHSCGRNPKKRQIMPLNQSGFNKEEFE